MPDNKSKALVRFENVQKSYDGEILVVKDLNLDIAEGEFLTMLGPSGSGKTTCLMMLAGFEPATHGEIYLDNTPINRVPPHKRGIGMVFQNYALFPHMTIGENLAFPLEVRKIPKSERDAKVKQALDMVQLGAFADRRPAQLSGGQQQRVAVARALVFNPEVVLTFVADFIGDNNCLKGTVIEALDKSCIVQTSDGSRITANKVNIEGVGKPSTLSIRPERVIVNPEASQVPNIFKAKALELIYLGDHIRTRMEVCGNDQFYVKNKIHYL